MHGYCKSFAVLIVTTYFFTAVYGLNNNKTNYNENDVSMAHSFSPNLQLTVETETKTSKTMTDVHGQDGEISQGRTFAVKRLQFMLLPVMYKMGVMTTLLVVLLIVSLKSLLIGTILLVIKISGFLAKFYHAEPHHETPWSPPIHSSPQPLPIHLHVSHSSDGHYDHHDHHVQDQVYHGWERSPPSQPDPYGSPMTMDNGQYYFKG